MSIRESEPHVRQSTEMRRLHIGMTAQRLDPIVEIVNADEKNVGSRLCRGLTVKTALRKKQQGPLRLR